MAHRKRHDVTQPRTDAHGIGAELDMLGFYLNVACSAQSRQARTHPRHRHDRGEFGA